mmetsp:Transcript_30719/g.70788  ORF Transcript_30719/g.70788 Transcript_30719/m.70788 type:complete len:130 (-) Transcript_30719:881-1270(-)
MRRRPSSRLLISIIICKRRSKHQQAPGNKLKRCHGGAEPGTSITAATNRPASRLEKTFANSREARRTGTANKGASCIRHTQVTDDVHTALEQSHAIFSSPWPLSYLVGCGKCRRPNLVQKCPRTCVQCL